MAFFNSTFYIFFFNILGSKIQIVNALDFRILCFIFSRQLDWIGLKRKLERTNEKKTWNVVRRGNHSQTIEHRFCVFFSVCFWATLFCTCCWWWINEKTLDELTLNVRLYPVPLEKVPFRFRFIRHFHFHLPHVNEFCIPLRFSSHQAFKLNSRHFFTIFSASSFKCYFVVLFHCFFSICNQVQW